MKGCHWPGWALLVWFLALPLHAAIVNPNHLYQETERLQQRLALLRQKAGLPAEIPQPGIQDNKLPIHLYIKAGEVHDYAAALQQARGLTPSAPLPLPDASVRPNMVMDPLQQIEQQLDSLLTASQIPLPSDEPEMPLGKSTNDVYRALWQLANGFDGLVPAAGNAQIIAALTQVQSGLAPLAKQLGKTLPTPSAEAASDKTPLDNNLVAYQCLHLMGRLLRQLNIEPTAPSHFPVGSINHQQVYDSALNLLAEVQKARASLGITDALPAAAPRQGDDNQIYAQLGQLRATLLALL